MSFLKSLLSKRFTGTHARQHRNRSGMFRSAQAELLESRALLTQLVTATVDNGAPVVDDTIEVTVQYNIENLARLSSQGVNVQMHFNSQELEFVGFKLGGAYELDGKVEPVDITNVTPADDTATGENKDSDANTDKFIKSVWNNAVGNWPGTSDPNTGTRSPKALPSNLYVAMFTVKAGFDGEAINFTGTPQGGETFSGTSVQIGGPTQSLTPTAPATAGIGETFEVEVPYNIQDIARNASQGLNVQMHFNSQELEFVGFKLGGAYELDGKVEPVDITNVTPADDSATGENKDGDANTDKFIKSVWNNAVGNWPGTSDPNTGTRTPKSLPSNLYVAMFTTLAGFDGETINFTGTAQGGARFEATPVTIDLQNAGFTVSKTTATIAEASTTSETFTVVLDNQPASDVVLTVDGSDTGEADVDLGILTFTTTNWDTPQTVTITAVDDSLIDGDQTSNVTVAIDDANSDDAFDTLPDHIVVVTTTDDDTAGYTLSKTTATVSESGTTDTFTVVLDSQPTSNVVLTVVGGDAEEATVDIGTLTFSPATWDTPQAVTITGVSDGMTDGDQTTAVTVSVDDANSDDAFDALADQTVSVTTTDILDFSFDIDDDGEFKPLADGIVIIRYLAGFTGANLIDGAVEQSGNRITAPEVVAYLDANQGMLDVDGEGDLKPLTDGILIIRYLAGFRGANLIDGAVEQTGSRTTAPAIEAYLSQFIGGAAAGPVAPALEPLSTSLPTPKAVVSPVEATRWPELTTTKHRQSTTFHPLKDRLLDDVFGDPLRLF